MDERRRGLALACAMVGALLLLVGVCLVLRPLVLLWRVEHAASTLADQVRRGQVDEARDTAEQMRSWSLQARWTTTGDGWRAAERLPLLGPDLRATRLLASAAADAGGALGPGLRIVAAVRAHPVRTHDGRLDPVVLGDLGGPASQVRDALERARRDLGGDGTDGGPQLRGVGWPLRSRVEAAAAGLDRLAGAARAGVLAARLAPAMLGERTYLLVVQNPAETRATGGLPGAIAALTLHDGRVQLGQTRSTATLPLAVTPTYPATPEEQSVFTDVLDRDFREMTMTPDFPSAARRLAAMWTGATQQHVDGVVSVDPVALADLLAVTGPVRVGSHSFTGDNVLRLLLNQPYLTLPDDAAQNAYFEAAAHGIFHAMLARPVSGSLLGSVQQSVDRRRVLLWSADPQEESLLQGSVIAGALPTRAGPRAQVGLYLNDSTGGKIEYYLDYDAALSAQGCTRDGRQLLVSALALQSRVPSAAARLPKYVVGFFDVRPVGAMRLLAYAVAPTGGRLLRLDSDGRPLRLTHQSLGGREVTTAVVTLLPGQSLTLRATALTAPHPRDAELEWTPGMHRGATSQTVDAHCP